MLPRVVGNARVAGCSEHQWAEPSLHPDVSQRIVLWYSSPSCVGWRSDVENLCHAAGRRQPQGQYQYIRARLTS
eukprot:12899930-Prorocentrum_lima.AAC.1